jgi:hypothetical protein
MKSKVIYVRVDEEVYDALKLFAEQNEKSLSRVASNCIRYTLTKAGKLDDRRQG